jgi:site-specific recombinase XerD
MKVLDQLGTEGKYEHLFINHRTGKRLTTVGKTRDRLRKEAGLPDLRLYDLRHEYASYLVNSGRSLYEVQQILGHSDPTITERYSHLSKESLLEAAN